MTIKRKWKNSPVLSLKLGDLSQPAFTKSLPSRAKACACACEFGEFWTNKKSRTHSESMRGRDHMLNQWQDKITFSTNKKSRNILYHILVLDQWEGEITLWTNDRTAFQYRVVAPPRALCTQFPRRGWVGRQAWSTPGVGEPLATGLRQRVRTQRYEVVEIWTDDVHGAGPSQTVCL